MSYPIDRKLVVAVSSNALFNMEKEDAIFVNEGLKAYKKFQIENKLVNLETGLAYPFIRRFLNINKVYSNEKPVEVVLLSKNSPETGIRVFNAIKNFGLDITRACFTSGKSPFAYIPAYNISLFLSTNRLDVVNAIEANYAAGRIIKTSVVDDNDIELRVAFDFDGVVADDEAERVYANSGGELEKYYEYETDHKQEPLNPGPLADFFKKLAFFQKLECKKELKDPNYNKILKTAIITARNAPAHERAINTLKEWNVDVDEMFLLGGIDKKRVLRIMKPHLFFDDQLTHLDPNLENIPLVHIPFGVANKDK